MKTELLKDMPIHMERIENNQSLKQDIEQIINSYEFEETDVPLISEEILTTITEFVNQNYTFKGI